jgi:hypothetical protein
VPVLPRPTPRGKRLGDGAGREASDAQIRVDAATERDRQAAVAEGREHRRIEPARVRPGVRDEDRQRDVLGRCGERAFGHADREVMLAEHRRRLDGEARRGLEVGGAALGEGALEDGARDRE